MAGAMILAGEFEAPNVAPEALPREPAEAGRYMQKAAYLCHSTAQFKSVPTSLFSPRTQSLTGFGDMQNGMGP